MTNKARKRKRTKRSSSECGVHDLYIDPDCIYLPEYQEPD